MRITSKILIIRFSSIGDIVLTTPVIRCLKNQIPGVEIHYLTKKAYFPVLEANPYLDKVWLYDKNFSDLLPQLQSQGFDQVIDLHKNYRSLYVARQLGVKYHSFNKLNVRKWLIVNFKLDFLPSIHIVDRYLSAVKRLGVSNDQQGLDFFLPETPEKEVPFLPESYNRGFIAVVLGGKHNTKILPAEKVVAICKKLNRPVVLLGGTEDHERGEKVVTEVSLKALNLCGSLSINGSARFLRMADAVLTNDTGLMHIAAAFHQRIVSVWGNTIPEFGMYPYMPGEDSSHCLIAEVKSLSCRPCSKLGHKQCPKNHFRCMNDIDARKITDFLNAAPARGDKQQD